MHSFYYCLYLHILRSYNVKHMKLKSYLCIGLAILTLSCNKGKNYSDSCNGSSTRREVKILTDDLVSELDTVAIVTTVDGLGSLDVPEASSDSKRQDVEKKVYSITAEVHKVSKHRDGDWKIKLTDGNDKYVNCEAPNMGCEFIENSIYFDQMEEVRKWIEENEGYIEGKVVTITGVAFIDIDHKYPRNAAENELELHPILSVKFD